MSDYEAFLKHGLPYHDATRFDRAIDLFIAYAENPLCLYSWTLAYERTVYVYGKRYAELAEDYYRYLVRTRLINPALE